MRNGLKQRNQFDQERESMYRQFGRPQSVETKRLGDALGLAARRKPEHDLAEAVVALQQFVCGLDGAKRLLIRAAVAVAHALTDVELQRTPVLEARVRGVKVMDLDQRDRVTRDRI